MAKTKKPIKDSWSFGARATSKDKNGFTNWFFNGTVKDPLSPNQLFTETGSHTVNTAHSEHDDLLKSFCKEFTCVDYSKRSGRAYDFQSYIAYQSFTSNEFDILKELVDTVNSQVTAVTKYILNNDLGIRELPTLSPSGAKLTKDSLYLKIWSDRRIRSLIIRCNLDACKRYKEVGAYEYRADGAYETDFDITVIRFLNNEFPFNYKSDIDKFISIPKIGSILWKSGKPVESLIENWELLVLCKALLLK